MTLQEAYESHITRDERFGAMHAALAGELLNLSDELGINGHAGWFWESAAFRLFRFFTRWRLPALEFYSLDVKSRSV